MKVGNDLGFAEVLRLSTDEMSLVVEVLKR